MKKLFGTDGIRGVANVEPMTTETAMQLGRAISYILRHQTKRQRIVIGKDTRLSGYMFETAMAAGICSMGADVMLVGPLPTPGIAFITKSMRADAGVVISASHNAFQDNGIKFFNHQGFKLDDRQEMEIEELVFGNRLDDMRPTYTEVGKAFRIDDATGRYIVFLKSLFPLEYNLEGLKIVVDCAHGAAYRAAPAVFSELGAEVITIGTNPDGKNINQECGSLHPEKMMLAIQEENADLGIALDGDADRVIIADEKGAVVDGDQIMAMCGMHLLEKGLLNKKTIAATVMSNLGLEIFIKSLGGKLVRTRVGDRYVVEEMRQKGYNLGGEQSGHIIFLDSSTTGDGMIAALKVLELMVEKQKPLSELAGIMEKYPQVIKNLQVKEKKPLEQIASYCRLKTDLDQRLGNSGRLLVRYSGTEPKVRVMCEGADYECLQNYCMEIIELLDKELNG